MAEGEEEEEDEYVPIPTKIAVNSPIPTQIPPISELNSQSNSQIPPNSELNLPSNTPIPATSELNRPSNSQIPPKAELNLPSNTPIPINSNSEINTSSDSLILINPTLNPAPHTEETLMGEDEEQIHHVDGMNEVGIVVKPVWKKIRREIVEVCIECFCFLFVYYLSSSLVFTHFKPYYKGKFTSSKVADAIYFTTVTFSSVGFGDLVPSSTGTKILMGFLTVLATGYLYRLLDSIFDYIFALLSISSYHDDYPAKLSEHKTAIVVALFVFLFGAQVVVVAIMESLGFWKSVYFSLVSSSTIGFGDTFFTTSASRWFGTIFLLLNPLLFGRLCEYFVKWRIESRKAKINRWILEHNNEPKRWWIGVNIPKTLYSFYKLKQLGKITEDDLKEVHEQFAHLDNAIV